MVGACLDQLGLRCGQLRTRRLQAAFLVLRIEPGDKLAGFYAVADVHHALEQPPVDAERLVDFGLRLHRPGQGHSAIGGTVFDGGHAHRADFRGNGLVGGLACGKQGQRRAGDDQFIVAQRALAVSQ